MMTRKDYVEVAKILSTFQGAIDEFTFEELILEFSDFFAEDNPRFNAEKFESACKENGDNE